MRKSSIFEVGERTPGAPAAPPTGRGAARLTGQLKRFPVKIKRTYVRRARFVAVGGVS